MTDEPQYIIIRHRSPETVAERVSETMDRGYMPHGRLFHIKDLGLYVQALIKPTTRKEQQQ